jgi:3-oxo-5-alpha-steroid 4-dehydrogenase 3
MHISHLFVGLAHYVCVPIALLAAEPIKFPFARNFACWLVFFMFSFIQYRCHAMLNDMKIAQLRSGKYKFPKGFLFDFVTCPHYFAEIGIYASILLLNPSHMEGWLVLIWVSSNLAVVSHVQYNWYKEKFPDEVPPSWKRLLPFVW